MLEKNNKEEIIDFDKSVKKFGSRNKKPKKKVNKKTTNKTGIILLNLLS